MKLIVDKRPETEHFLPLIYSLNVSQIMSFHLFHLLWNHPNQTLEKKSTTGLFFRAALPGFDGNVKCVSRNGLALREQN